MASRFLPHIQSFLKQLVPSAHNDCSTTITFCRLAYNYTSSNLSFVLLLQLQRLRWYNSFVASDVYYFYFILFYFFFFFFLIFTFIEIQGLLKQLKGLLQYFKTFYTQVKRYMTNYIMVVINI